MAVFFLWQNIRYAFEPFKDHGTIERYTCSLSGNVVKNSVQMVKQDTKLPCSFFFTENLREKKYPVLLSYNINAYQDEFVDRQVMNLEVTCGKKEYGCLWFNRLKYQSMRESHKDKDDLKDELARLKQNLATLMDRVKEMVMKDQLLQKRVTLLEEENLGFKKHITNFRKDMMKKNEAIEALKKEIKGLKSKGTQQTTDADIAGQSRPPGSLKFTGVDIVIRSVEEIEELRRKLQQQQNCAYCESNQRPASFDCKDADGEDYEGYCQDESDGLEDLYS